MNPVPRGSARPHGTLSAYRDLATAEMKAFQDRYPDEFAHCFGCGRLNAEGYHLRSYWDGEGTVARFVPRPYHTAVPGFVNGGLLASLVDCHATGTSAAAAARARGVTSEEGPLPRFVTASLELRFRRPTPLGPELVVRGRASSVAGRRVVVDTTISAGEEVTVQGTVVCAELPATMRLGDRS